MSKSKLWYTNHSIDKTVEDFTVGDDYILDTQLIEYDCIASIAHVKMLAKIGVLKSVEVDKLVNQLERIKKLSKEGKFSISKEQEDAHTAIENELTDKLGELGKKIHTGRSRNDQVLTALRLYYKDNLNECILLSKEFIRSLNIYITRYGNIEIPGYTHTRKAMPSSIKLWADAFIESAHDNISLIESASKLVDQSPLGTGAGYGSPIRLDRKYTAIELHFSRVQKNPIYAQLSRGKFESTILHVLSQIMFDLNRIATDLIIFSMPEFGYYELPRNLATGSSMMPHKKNPDILEILRAKYHVVVAYENQVKNVSANLPIGYNRDLQLTKEPVMKGFIITKQSLKVAALIFNNIKVNGEMCKKAMTQELYATERAYNLVEKGMPFRDAYQRIAKEIG